MDTAAATTSGASEPVAVVSGAAVEMDGDDTWTGGWVPCSMMTAAAAVPCVVTTDAVTGCTVAVAGGVAVAAGVALPCGTAAEGVVVACGTAAAVDAA
jgi:hypothetical protein